MFFFFFFFFSSVCYHFFTLSDIGFCSFSTNLFFNRSENSGIVHSTHLFEEPRYISTTLEEWHIDTEKYSYIVFRFDFFDISCYSTSKLYINLQTSSLCNLNKPLNDIRTSGNHMEIYFDPTRRLSALVEGFSGTYEARYRPNTTVEEQKGILSLKAPAVS